MIITFKILLIIVTLISFLGVVGERENKGLQNNLTAICIVAIIGFIISSLVL